MRNPNILATPLRISSNLLLLGALAASAWGGEAAAQAKTRAGSGSAGEVMELPEKDQTIEPNAEPVFTVGVAEGEDWEMFGWVASLAFDSAGNLYVLDEQAYRVIVFGPDGGFLRTFGREGRGPGELFHPVGLGVLDDGSAAVLDLANGGVTLFDAEGKYAGSVAISRGRQGSGFKWGEFQAQRARGGFLEIVEPLGFTLGPGGAMGRPEEVEGVPIFFHPARDGGASEVIHRAWMPPWKEPELNVRTSERRSSDGTTTTTRNIGSTYESVFDAGRFLAVLPDGRMVLSDSTAYSLKVLSPGGVAAHRLNRPLHPVPVTKGVRKRTEEGLREIWEARVKNSASGNLPDESYRKAVDDAAKAFAAKQVRGLEFAEVIPVVTGLAADWEGRIWVQRGRMDGSQAWEAPGPIDLVTADGRYLGTIPPNGIRIPRAFGPGGLMAYLVEGEDGVPRVAVKRLAGVGG